MQPRAPLVSSKVSTAFVRADGARAETNGCPWHDVRAMLRKVGLRPTRQRMELGWLLFSKGDRHLTAEMLFEEASSARVPVSLATVYNTLNLFVEKGLLCEHVLAEGRLVYDPNTTRHHHFIDEATGRIHDIPWDALRVQGVESVPGGFSVREYQVVMRGHKKKRG